MFGAKGLLYTIDIFMFIIVFIVIVAFSTIQFSLYSTQTGLGDDLTFREASIFMNGKWVLPDSVSDYNWYVCRTVVKYDLTATKICNGGQYGQ